MRQKKWLGLGNEGRIRKKGSRDLEPMNEFCFQEPGNTDRAYEGCFDLKRQKDSERRPMDILCLEGQKALLRKWPERIGCSLKTKK